MARPPHVTLLRAGLSCRCMITGERSKSINVIVQGNAHVAIALLIRCSVMSVLCEQSWTGRVSAASFP
jgi:hypothetical protein